MTQDEKPMTDQQQPPVPAWLREEASYFVATLRTELYVWEIDAIAAFALRVGERLAQEKAVRVKTHKCRGMTVLNAAELSRLARIASNPKLARERKTEKRLHGHARNVARALLGEKKGISEGAAKTASVVKQWTSRQMRDQRGGTPAMTDRDVVAMHILSGILAAQAHPESACQAARPEGTVPVDRESAEWWARFAYVYADALFRVADEKEGLR